MRCATSRTARDNSWRCACDMAQSNNTSQDEGRDQGIPPILLGVSGRARRRSHLHAGSREEGLETSREFGVELDVGIARRGPVNSLSPVKRVVA